MARSPSVGHDLDEPVRNSNVAVALPAPRQTKVTANQAIAHVQRLQRTAGNRVVGMSFGGTPLLQRDPQPDQTNAKAVKSREIAQIDREFNPLIEAVFDDHAAAISVLSAAVKDGGDSYSAVQKEVNASNAEKMEALNFVFLAVGSFPLVGVFKGLEGIADALEKMKGAVDLAKNAATAGKSVTSVLSAMQPPGSTTPPASTPAGLPPTTGDPVSFFLDHNTELQRLKSAFHNSQARGAEIIGALSDDDWKSYDTAKYRAEYQTSYNSLKDGALLPDAFPAAAVAKKYEVGMWLTYLKALHAVNYDLDTAVEERLTELGIASAAGVTLTGHWYEPNSPDDWRIKLMVYAGSFG